MMLFVSSRRLGQLVSFSKMGGLGFELSRSHGYDGCNFSTITACHLRQGMGQLSRVLLGVMGVIQAS
jgi:hypothetical protein